MENLTAYLLFTGCGAVVCVLWFFASFRRKAGTKKAALLSSLILLLGILLGVFCARLLWVLMRISAFPPLFAFRWDELSYYGGMAGVILAVCLSALAVRLPVREVLNAFAPMGALMAAAARFAEGFLGMYGTGFVEEWIERGVFFPVTVEIAWSEDYSEFYLAVFMFSGLFSLAAMVLSLLHGKEPDRFLRTLFYLCLPQILLETMRTTSIVWLFVRLEQLVCFLVCEGVLVYDLIRNGAGRLRSWLPALTGLLACGIIVVSEFARDGKILIGNSMVSPWLCWLVTAAALAAMAAAEHAGRRPVPRFRAE